MEYLISSKDIQRSIEKISSSLVYAETKKEELLNSFDINLSVENIDYDYQRFKELIEKFNSYEPVASYCNADFDVKNIERFIENYLNDDSYSRQLVELEKIDLHIRKLKQIKLNLLKKVQFISVISDRRKIIQNLKNNFRIFDEEDILDLISLVKQFLLIPKNIFEWTQNISKIKLVMY